MIFLTQNCVRGESHGRTISAGSIAQSAMLLRKGLQRKARSPNYWKKGGLSEDRLAYNAKAGEDLQRKARRVFFPRAMRGEKTRDAPKIFLNRFNFP